MERLEIIAEQEVLPDYAQGNLIRRNIYLRAVDSIMEGNWKIRQYLGRVLKNLKARYN